MPSFVAVEDTLRCVRLRWATRDGEKIEFNAGRPVEKNECTVAGKLFWAISFQDSLSTVQLEQSSSFGPGAYYWAAVEPSSGLHE